MGIFSATKKNRLSHQTIHKDFQLFFDAAQKLIEAYQFKHHIIELFKDVDQRIAKSAQPGAHADEHFNWELNQYRTIRSELQQVVQKERAARTDIRAVEANIMRVLHSSAEGTTELQKHLTSKKHMRQIFLHFEEFLDTAEERTELEDQFLAASHPAHATYVKLVKLWKKEIHELNHIVHLGRKYNASSWLNYLKQIGFRIIGYGSALYLYAIDPSQNQPGELSDGLLALATAGVLVWDIVKTSENLKLKFEQDYFKEKKELEHAAQLREIK